MRILLAVVALAMPAIASDRFTGWQSCATTGCHGGGKGDDQVIIWQKQDRHARAYGTLISERSKRMAEALGVADAAKSNQCTVCHSPMQSAAPDLLAPSLKRANQGVSCETCHSPAEDWLRFHTRLDITHAHRVSAGLRDLDSPYQRANTCVGCHANVPAEITKAGHPTPRFELARQLAQLPPHWSDFEINQSPRSWLTSQAVLLRELCWLSEKGNAHPDRIAALRWILRETELGAEQLPADAEGATLRTAADRLAKNASAARWTPTKTRALFDRFTTLAAQVRDAAPATAYARAEVLTPALHATILGLDPAILEKTKTQLSSLDLALRSAAIFDAKRYAELVTELTTAVQSPPKPSPP